jgi:hypothetical protein
MHSANKYYRLSYRCLKIIKGDEGQAKRSLEPSQLLGRCRYEQYIRMDKMRLRQQLLRSVFIRPDFRLVKNIYVRGRYVGVLGNVYMKLGIGDMLDLLTASMN